MNKFLLIPEGQLVYPGQQVAKFDKTFSFGKGLYQDDNMLISSNLGKLKIINNILMVENP